MAVEVVQALYFINIDRVEKEPYCECFATEKSCYVENCTLESDNVLCYCTIKFLPLNRGSQPFSPLVFYNLSKASRANIRKNYLLTWLIKEKKRKKIVFFV